MRREGHKAYNDTTMLKSAVLHTIKAQGLLKKGEKLGVAISGGADSVALLHVLCSLADSLGIYVCALHFEHGIRGEASLADMALVKEFCKALCVPLYIGQENVIALAKTKKLNLEAAARSARYGFFEQARDKYKIDKIAIAHHSDDYAETLLFHLVRGSGTAGLSSMPYAREPGIIRPMLDATRAQIEAYIKQNNLAYCMDETNQDTKYARNLIRAKAMPVLREVNPEVSQAFLRAGDVLSVEEDFLNDMAKQAFSDCAVWDEEVVTIDIKKLHTNHLAVQRRVIRQAFAALGLMQDLSKDSIDRALALSEMGQTGKKVTLVNKVVAIYSYGALIIRQELDTIDAVPIAQSYEIKEGAQSVLGEDFFIVSLAQVPQSFPKAKSFVQYIDADAVKNAVIRYRNPGDIFKPLGMQGEKKLKDWLIDNKIPQEQRNSIPLLAKGNEVLWVVGYQISETCKISEKTKRIYKVEYQKTLGEK